MGEGQGEGGGGQGHLEGVPRGTACHVAPRWHYLAMHKSGGKGNGWTQLGHGATLMGHWGPRTGGWPTTQAPCPMHMAGVPATQTCIKACPKAAPTPNTHIQAMHVDPHCKGLGISDVFLTLWVEWWPQAQGERNGWQVAEVFCRGGPQTPPTKAPSQDSLACHHTLG